MHKNHWLVSQARGFGVWHQLPTSRDPVHGSSQEFWGICFLHHVNRVSVNLGMVGERDIEAPLEGKESSLITGLGNCLGSQPDAVL